jgi:aldehyde dehydrogenase (NAD+)
LLIYEFWRYDEIVEEMVNMVESITVGDPSDTSTSSDQWLELDQQQRVRSYIELGIQEGARLVVGGAEVPKGLEDGY